MATYARKPEEVQVGSAADEPSFPPPVRSVEECTRILTAPGAIYEYEQRTIFGRDLRVFKNLPASLRDFWLLTSQGWADREYLILGDERVTYKQVRTDLLEDESKAEFCPRSRRMSGLL